MAITRRTLLKIGAATATGVVAAGGFLLLRPTILRTPRTALRVLSEKEFSVLAAVADRICPANPPFPSAWSMQVPEKIDALLATGHPATASEVKQALQLLESAAAGMVMGGRTTTFTGSSAAEQDAILAEWRSSSLQVRRIAYKALNGLVSATYWATPDRDFMGLVGYPGPPHSPVPA